MAVGFLSEASDCQQQIEDLGEHHANGWEARNLGRYAHFALKMANVHALLANATRGQAVQAAPAAGVALTFDGPRPDPGVGRSCSFPGCDIEGHVPVTRGRARS